MMSYYKNIFQKRIEVAGSSKGAKPAFMMPPDGAFSKMGYAVYEALDLICEGPVAGLVDQKGILLQGDRATKNFDSPLNAVGDNVSGIDRGIYYNDVPLRTEGGVPTAAKYDISFMSGGEFQDGPKILKSPRRLVKVNELIKGPYIAGGASNGARSGTGSQDIRTEPGGGSAHLGPNLSIVGQEFGTTVEGEEFVEDDQIFGVDRATIISLVAVLGVSVASGGSRDFVNWQNFIPAEVLEKPYVHTNYDKNVTKLDVTLVVNTLNDTRTAATASENEAGRSKMGQPTPITITFEIGVGKADKFGNETISPASFIARGGKGVTLGEGNGRIAVSGIVTSAYHVSLENIVLPEISEDDLYNFIRIRKIEAETFSNVVNRDGGVAHIAEIVDETLLYPNSVIVESSIDAKYFANVPSRTFRLKGKKVLIPSNYTPINADGSDRRFHKAGEASTRGNLIYSGDWDGTFKFGWTDNPAWIYYDLLVNTRYGVGSYLRDVNIVDKWSLYEIGMYCDAVTMNDNSQQTKVSGAGVFIGLDDGFGGLEPRFSSNVIISDQAKAYETLQDFAKSFMAMTYYNNSVINVRIDQPFSFESFERDQQFEEDLSDSAEVSDEFIPPKELQFPSHLNFNNLNVKDGIFVYSDVDKNTKFNAVEVSYLDKRNNFTYKTEYEEDPESIKEIGVNFRQMAGLGVTSRGQAKRLARSLLFESINTSEKVSFTAGLDALLLEPGDIIRIDDELKGFTKNFGVVLGTSGQTTYYDPDSTGTLPDITTGLGPRAIIVDPAKQSDQLDYLTGGVLTIRNPLGQSGIDQFYSNPTADNDLYKRIHQPQTIELKLHVGGSGFTYDVLDDGLALYIDGVATFKDGSGGTNLPSQWFSEKDVNILHGSHYTVDASGRFPRYYRVLSIEESPDQGFDVSATVFYTGKHKFIEEGISFDINEDVFEPELSLSQVQTPNPPQGISTGAFVQQADNSLVLPIQITGAASIPGDRFVVILEEPNTNSIIGEVNKSVSLVTNFNLSGNQKIDQIGDYTITVFSENASSNVRSIGFATLNFSTTPGDFLFDINNDAFIEYANISLDTNFGQGYSSVDRTGSGDNSFKQFDPSINAVFNMVFKDAFNNSGNAILPQVSGQIINLKNVQGDLLASPLKTLSNETTVTITNDELNSGFGYTGDGRYLIPPSVDFEISKFTLTGTGTSTSSHFVSFEESFDETPVVFTSQVLNDIKGSHAKIGIVSVGSGGFTITGLNRVDSSYNYIATKTGTFLLNNSLEKIEVGIATKTGASGYSQVQFSNTFDSVPNVIIQIQQPEIGKESYFSETVITGITTSGFSFNAFQPDGSNPSGTGNFAYIATEDSIFNVSSSSQFPIQSINYASTGEASFEFTSGNVFESINGSNNAGLRFNHDNSAVFPQRIGVNAGMQDKCMAVFRTTGNTNQISLHYFDRDNVTSGMYFGSSDESLNFIDVESTGVTYEFTGDLSLETWARFDEGLTGKQYLFEHYLSGTGIGWFQSGDGKNYINVNGTDFEASATNLNDGEKHNVRVVLDRDAGIKTYVDGSLDITNTGITGSGFTGDIFASTSFKVLANSQQTGSTLHQGGVYHYFGFIASGITGDYTNSPDLFRDTYSGHADSVFLINTGESSIVDYTANNNQVTISGDLIVLDQLIDQTSLVSNISILQISSTGQL
ncbi:MAG: phage tail protein [Methylophilaceae bacterium]